MAWRSCRSDAPLHSSQRVADVGGTEAAAALGVVHKAGRVRRVRGGLRRPDRELHAPRAICQLSIWSTYIMSEPSEMVRYHVGLNSTVQHNSTVIAEFNVAHTRVPMCPRPSRRARAVHRPGGALEQLRRAGRQAVHGGHLPQRRPAGRELPQLLLRQVRLGQQYAARQCAEVRAAAEPDERAAQQGGSRVADERQSATAIYHSVQLYNFNGSRITGDSVHATSSADVQLLTRGTTTRRAWCT